MQANRVRKSIGAETSFAEDLDHHDDILKALQSIAHTLHQRVQEQQTGGRTLTLKVKFGHYQQMTRSRTLVTAIQDAETILCVAMELLETIDLHHHSVRLLGISLSNLENRQQQSFQQLPLF